MPAQFILMLYTAGTALALGLVSWGFPYGCV